MNLFKIVYSVFICSVLFACDKPDISDFHDQTALKQYDKLDVNGQLLEPTSLSWKCTYDPATDLTWENKSDDEAAQDHAWTYIWYIPDQGTDRRESLQNDGSCNRDLIGKCTTEHHIRYLNQNKVCGYNDWRLPTKSELTSIIDTSRPAQIPKVCDCFFSHTKPNSYWTRTESADRDKAYALNFVDGNGDYYPKFGSFYVRAVRGKSLNTD